MYLKETIWRAIKIEGDKLDDLNTIKSDSMNIEYLREYCLAKAGTDESFPFGPSTLVFKIKGKMYLLTNLDSIPLQFNVKCDPEKALNLRDEYPDSVLPGYHMNKKHWNTVLCNGEIPLKELLTMVDESYDLVRKLHKP